MQIEGEFEKLKTFYPVLGDLSAALQNAIVESGYLVQASPGRILFDVDEIIQSFIMLSQGSIQMILPGKERELLIFRMGPGDCCIVSICHLLDDTRYRVRAQVESAICGIALPHALFDRLVNESPAFNHFVYHAMAERLTSLLHLLESVTSFRLDQRLAELLLSKGMLINTTHERLADELGSVREVISRILKDFEAKGMLKLERGVIRILDPEPLRNLSEIRDSSH